MSPVLAPFTTRDFPGRIQECGGPDSNTGGNSLDSGPAHISLCVLELGVAPPGLFIHDCVAHHASSRAPASPLRNPQFCLIILRTRTPLSGGPHPSFPSQPWLQRPSEGSCLIPQHPQPSLALTWLGQPNVLSLCTVLLSPFSSSLSQLQKAL